MTATEARTPTIRKAPGVPFGGEPVRRVVDVDGIPMSALLAAAPVPRGVIVALHGGATSSAYFDCPGHPRHSLIRVASALGYTIIALDRPGYGSSHPHADEIRSDDHRVELAYGAVDKLLETRSSGSGMFLFAHSVGSELAVRMAATERGRTLLGIELSGTGTEHHPESSKAFPPNDPGARPDGSAVRELLWNPSRLYPPDIHGGRDIAARGPGYEYEVVRDWPLKNFPDLAAQIAVPVHFTVGEYERVWRNDPDARFDLGALFSASPRVVVEEQFDGGHNLSLGNTAMAYHLNVLSFIEECIDARNPWDIQ
ncbi:MAG: alpha/beta hydrolase [Gordonia sp.]|nr:alpha/beta hydrolase [Gordonia sp. (in: high G+C Gram-positive bacteria)]